MNKKINLTCPGCKKIVEIDSKFKPFCSKACKSIDFLRWANEEVAIETFENQDVVVIAQKIVSKAENRYVDLNKVI